MGQLLGIAKAPRRRAALVEVLQADIDPVAGIIGDARGRTPNRQVTVLVREGWHAACRELRAEIPWITRRANLLIDGLAVPREGARLIIGRVVLEVTQETQPCRLMEAAHRGLRQALLPEWRGGVCCRGIGGGTVHVGDGVEAS